MSRSSPERRNPDLLAQDGVSGGIEDLGNRISRYGKAKQTGLDVAEYMQGLAGEQFHKVAQRVTCCGDYLLFRHFYTVDQVRLHAAQFCKKHLLCPLCAIRRGAKALGAYLARFEAIKAQRPQLRAWLVTLTVKDGEDLAERFDHLKRSQHELWKRRHRGRGSVLAGIAGAVWSYEIKRGSGSGLWHPHLHMVALAEHQPDQVELAREWQEITGDSYIVDVRPISQEDPASGFIEVFKYAVKFSDQEPADTVHAWQTLRGRRLLASSGAFRGVEVPPELTDSVEDLAGLPYVDLFYRYLAGKGYNLEARKTGNQAATPRKERRAPRPRTEDEIGVYERFRRLHIEECERRGIKPDRRVLLR